MQADRLQSQRFEIKFLVPESVALAARDFVQSYLALDDFCTGRGEFSYPVHSLYLDSEALTFYRQTLNGDKNRFKLRVRFYDDKLTSPIFLEIKRRTKDAVSKQRGTVSRQAILQILSGQIPEANLLAAKNPTHMFALQMFIQLMLQNRAKPMGHVAYEREAWISTLDNSVRVTMDRAVRFEADRTSRLTTSMQSPVSVFGSEVVLELKFTRRFPDWFKEFVRVFNLTRCSAAKYAEGLTLFGEQRMRNGAYATGFSEEHSRFSPADLLEEVA